MTSGIFVTDPIPRHLKDIDAKETDMPDAEALEKMHIACAAIVPECPYCASAATEEELMAMVAAHARNSPGISISGSG